MCSESVKRAQTLIKTFVARVLPTPNHVLLRVWSERVKNVARPSVRARRQLASISDISDISDGVCDTVMGSKVTVRFSGMCKGCLKLKTTKGKKKPWVLGDFL